MVHTRKTGLLAVCLAILVTLVVTALVSVMFERAMNEAEEICIRFPHKVATATMWSLSFGEVGVRHDIVKDCGSERLATPLVLTYNVMVSAR